MFTENKKRECFISMKNFKKCVHCLGMTEYELINMKLCEYHFIKLNNDLFSKNGYVHMTELMRLLD